MHIMIDKPVVFSYSETRKLALNATNKNLQKHLLSAAMWFCYSHLAVNARVTLKVARAVSQVGGW